MMTRNFLVFLIGIFGTTSSLHFEGNPYSDSAKIVSESSFLPPKIWRNFPKLLATENEDSFCRINPGVVFAHPTIRKLYYRCQNGRRELFRCVERFEFDKTRSKCAVKTSFKNWNKNPAPNDCANQTDGFYPDYRSTCQEYYRCENGTRVEQLRCPPAESFAFHLQQCRPEEEVVCVKSKCHRDNDGYFAFPGFKCQAFYSCRSGSRSDFICPRGETFDVQTRTCVANGICYEPVCTGRIDGTYPDTTHNCIRSFTCKGGKVLEVSSCPAGQKHNGSSCVSSQDFTCEKPEKTAAVFYFPSGDECRSLRDGNHPVPGTDCRDVRVCSRGKTVAAFECLRGERSDGNRCLPKSVVVCDDACSMKADGYYANESTNCREYYYCLNEKVFVRKKCPNGTAFSGETCIPENLVFCPNKLTTTNRNMCAGLGDGYHPDYLNSCRSFFYCYNHKTVLTESCSDGLIYDGKKCVNDDGIIWCDGPKDLDECIGRPVGLYRNETSNCTRYFYCNNGRGTGLSCPRGLLFNGYKCVGEDNYTCSNSANMCDEQPDGYKQDENTGCRTYYFCSNGSKITYVCPNQMIFNGTQCVAQDAYDCPFASSRDCVDKADGYHADKSSDCRDYHYCSRGEKLKTLTCEGKKIFDGKGCVFAKDALSVCFGSLDNTCSGKVDGTYADVKSDCKRYFVCSKNSVTGHGWCPKGFGFNGRTCSRNFNCRRQNFCVGKQSGFYQDLSSGCRNYYFCFLNTQIIGVCPFGTIFNGQLCIDSYYYKCPSEER